MLGRTPSAREEKSMNTSKVISRRSNLVLISVLITIIIIVFSTVSFLYVVNDIQKLTNFINSTGSIRGGIQRVTKLYLLNQDDNATLFSVNLFLHFLHRFGV